MLAEPGRRDRAEAGLFCMAAIARLQMLLDDAGCESSLFCSVSRFPLWAVYTQISDLMWYLDLTLTVEIFSPKILMITGCPKSSAGTYC